MAFLLRAPALLTCSLTCLVVCLVASLAAGLVEASLGAAFGAALGLAAAGSFFEAALAFFSGLSSFLHRVRLPVPHFCSYSGLFLVVLVC
jgi:hypothetical protein